MKNSLERHSDRPLSFTYIYRFCHTSPCILTDTCTDTLTRICVGHTLYHTCSCPTFPTYCQRQFPYCALHLDETLPILLLTSVISSHILTWPETLHVFQNQVQLLLHKDFLNQPSLTTLCHLLGITSLGISELLHLTHREGVCC